MIYYFSAYRSRSTLTAAALKAGARVLSEDSVQEHLQEELAASPLLTCGRTTSGTYQKPNEIDGGNTPRTEQCSIRLAPARHVDWVHVAQLSHQITAQSLV